MSNATSDSAKCSLQLGIAAELKEEYPILNMVLFAVTNILQNNHLQKNFSPHFIPIDQYQYDFPVHSIQLHSSFLVFLFSVGKRTRTNTSSNKRSVHRRTIADRDFSG